MKIIIIGSVSSSKVVADRLFMYNYRNVRIYGYETKNSPSISDWCDLRAVSNKYSYEYEPFIKIKDCETSIKEFSPDYIFAVGISQIIPDSILKIPKVCTIGFHPTKLPEGRGRAPIPWMILEDKKEGAATFFIISKGVDDGAIISQTIFNINSDDDAKSLTIKMLESEKKSLDLLLPDLKNINKFSGLKQQEDKASWYGKREPYDGLIDWSQDSKSILKLIRATTYPYPCAFTFYNQNKIKIIKAKLIFLSNKGVSGRIIKICEDNTFIVQTGNGLLKIILWEANEWEPKVGFSLGLNIQKEIIELRGEIKKINNFLNNLDKKNRTNA